MSVFHCVFCFIVWGETILVSPSFFNVMKKDEYYNSLSDKELKVIWDDMIADAVINYEKEEYYERI